MSSLMDRVAGAPISWGVCEVPGWGLSLPVQRVLAEMQQLGIRATELGPTGYLPVDPTAQATLLRQHDLTLVGAFLPVVLHLPDRAADELAAAEQAMAVLQAAGASVLVVAAATGVDGYETSVVLDDEAWHSIARLLDQLEERARAYGLQVALHPHVGTVIANAVEVQQLLATTRVRLCLDTGHLAIGGVDVLALAAEAGDRIVHVHLKDVDLALAARVSAGEMAYAEAVRAGLYRPLGRGDVPIAELVQVLEEQGYTGWYVLEQDVAFHAEPEGPGPVADVRACLEFLRQTSAQIAAAGPV